MAPMTRRAANSGVSKNVHRKKPVRREQSEEWDLLDQEEPIPTTNGSTHGTEALTDLRSMADRVGREVDTFAETLDKYNEQLRGSESYEAAHELCISYKTFADGVVKKLRKEYDVQRMQDMKESFAQRGQRSATALTRRRSSASTRLGTDADKEGLNTLNRWRAEADTWELFRIMLELRFNPNKEDLQAQREHRLERLGQQHRYAPESNLWERFTLENDAAKERALVLKWLEEAADHGENDINAIAEELENRSGRGSGLWVNGWMETRERIKGAKRMNVPGSSSEDLEIKRSDNNEPLVSALDPDAPNRQRRTLEKADAYSERSLWMACWEMIRRGRSWSQICQWCLERNQSWRAISMGIGSESEHDHIVAGAAGGLLWRRMCYVAATSGTVDEYEAAVYGLLSGDLDTVLGVCRTWDDHIYAHYNSALLSQFDQYLIQQDPQKLSSAFTKRFGQSSVLQRQTSPATMARNLISKLSLNSITSKEAHSAIKLLQGSLIADTFEDLVSKVGIAVSDAAWQDHPSSVIRPIRKASTADVEAKLVESAISEDHDTLRIVTHMLIMVREYHMRFAQNTESEAVDNVIAAYVVFLRTTGKRDLTPIYASKMAKDRAVASLAQVLSDIDDPQESMDFIKLMDIYDVDSIAVLNGQYKYLLGEAMKAQILDVNLHILEDTVEDLYPGQRIELRFLPHDVTDEEQGLVSALEVFYLLEGHWDVTFQALTYACRRLLATGHFAAARLLVRRLDFETLSTTKSSSILGKAINVMDPDQVAQVSAISDRAMQVQLLQQQSQTYYQLSALVKAVEALDHWRKVEHEYASKTPRPSSLPAKVKKAYEEVSATIEPLLNGILQEAKDEDEEADLLTIRTNYLPEIILAYNTVLCTAGHMISREELLTSMDLSTVIAADGSGLGEAFVKAGRVKELVISFAQTSKIMLKLNETGKQRKEKKARGGRSLAVWEING